MRVGSQQKTKIDVFAIYVIDGFFLIRPRFTWFSLGKGPSRCLGNYFQVVF